MPSRTCAPIWPPIPATVAAAATRWADTGLDAGLVREQVRAYQQRYGVPDEPLK